MQGTVEFIRNHSQFLFVLEHKNEAELELEDLNNFQLLLRNALLQNTARGELNHRHEKQI